MRTNGATPLPRQGEGSGEGASVAARLAALMTRLFGMPEYERYVQHQSAHHPSCAVMSEKEFVRSELERKYAGGGGRCC